ncbi:Vesicle transport protein [Cyanidiococcus yangmingshanensis]|uniref:Vesicle transport protein n=1 Tax=Cyanidiococcus yangmingshanensis TaxID=2690220 RepID=A0A7J7IQF7_9RHOD|nr:Vesicle transport protein [Cyanidiococcus yangmingshanensis]
MSAPLFRDSLQEQTDPPWYAYERDLGTSTSFSWAAVRELFEDGRGRSRDLEGSGSLNTATISERDVWGLDELWHCSRTQRFLLFAMVFGTGVVVSCLAVALLPMLILRPQKFAFAFSLGQILLITSTWLVVPLKVQLRALSVPERAAAAAVYGMALLLALATSMRHLALLALFFMLVQISAIAWYLLTFLPFGRGWIWSWITSSMGMNWLQRPSASLWPWTVSAAT